MCVCVCVCVFVCVCVTYLTILFGGQMLFPKEITLEDFFVFILR